VNELPRPTLDQQRAKHAYDSVQKAISKLGAKTEKVKKFGGQAMKLPTRIIASGLGQAIAFLRAKKEAPELLDALSDWVLSRLDGASHHPHLVNDRSLLERIINGDADLLRRMTDEALAYMQWLKRFVEAEGLKEEN